MEGDSVIWFFVCWALCSLPLFVLGVAEDDQWWNAIPTAVFGGFFFGVALYGLGA